MGADPRGGRTLRILRLWRLYGTLDFLWVTRDFRSFLGYYLSDAVLTVAAVSAVFLLAERFQGIGRWSRGEILFMLGYASLVGGVVDTLFGYNVKLVSRRVGRGQMDHVLLQPQPIWMTLLTEGFVPFSGSAALLPGLALILWTLPGLSVAVSPDWVGLALLNLCGSTGVVLAFSYVWGSLAFWAPRSAEEISTSSVRMLDQLRSFPLDGLSPIALGGLLSFLPVGLVAWYPARALLGLDPNPRAVWLTPAAAVAACAGAALIFRLGLIQYGRTGSQRYSALGHRG